ncbi:hypothetical protein CC86DRAFT_80506 [Ophiobolus disseminans]|uniref:Uncharacterized protein n=1 Tax=Ophiobolus disseminans TaxID=1469910 RepID=A0A6A6ZQ89_9PLEO|nr:hypothetical protein CC86DRAFT_80506 [Ophiobolus disseminans]
MVEARDAAHDAASKILSKGSRWKTKLFSKEEAPPKPPPQTDDDVNAFLKPSTDRAQQQRDTAAAVFARPRLDIAAAKRWPSSRDILGSAGKSPGPGGLATGRSKKGLTVGFVRQVPEIIGYGGEEYDEPAVEVSKRKKSSIAANPSHLQPQRPQDDANLGAGVNRTPSLQEQRNSLTRTKSSGGELSPPLEKKLEMGHINTQIQPPPPPPQGVGQMGLGMRPPRPGHLTRAPTGFDSPQPEPSGRRTSNDSDYSQDSDNMSPVLARKISNVEPTIQEEEENFKPKPLLRTQTGIHELGAGSTHEPMPAIPAISRLPEMQLAQQEEYSPLDGKAMLAEQYLQSGPARTDSFSARVKHKMRADEGKALLEGAQQQVPKRNSDSSMQSERPLQVGTPPSPYHPPPSAGRMAQPAPPALPPRASPSRRLEAEDPYRSRVRGPSPARHAMPPGTFPLDTDGRPQSSSSSHHTIPSATSYVRTSPAMRSDPFSATTASSVQRTPSNSSQAPSLQAPPQFEQRAAPHPVAQMPPPHAQSPRMQLSPLGEQLPLRPRPDTRDREREAAPLARSDTRSLGDAAYKEFAERVTHMRGIFQLTAQLGGQLNDRTSTQWLRVATWYFLKGRAAMENAIRSRPRSAEAQPERLTQGHVDLAKVLWILTEILPNHPGVQQYGGQTLDAQLDLARQAGDRTSAEAFEIQSAILHYMKLLVGSMKKHQSMPPTQALIQGQDQSIWAEYPIFAPDAASVLQAGIPRSGAGGNGPTHPVVGLSQLIPLADTKNDFCYFRMFVKASMSTDDPNTDRVQIPAVVSVLRPKDQYQVKLAICSQNELINIILGPGGDGGPTWDDVDWKKPSSLIHIHLRHGFTLTLELSEADWRSLFSIVDHTNRVQSDLRERRDERFACKLQLREAGYKDPANPGAFPPERVVGCKLMVFERFDRSSEGTGKRKLHRGYRMALATSQQNKQVSIINHELGTKQAPMNFEYVTEADNVPALRLHFREETPDKKVRTCTVHLVFQESKDRNQLFGIFTSMNIAPGEMAFAQVPLKSYHIESADQAEGFSQQGSRVLDKLQWQEAKVVNQDPEAAGLESAPTVMSESLRIVCRHSAGVIADRMNLGPGELLVRLPIDGAAELTLLRNAQQDLAVAIDGSRTERDMPDALAELLRTLSTASTLRKLTFNSFKDMHDFQYAVTGFDVKFDGIASSFSISRRRMVVPIYKQWTANIIRIQIVQQDNIIQLLAFFEEFSHADAMNFKLSTMDTFEKSDKGGKFGLKLVDAKFALPVEERRGEGKMQKEEGRLTGWAGIKRKFVCLDEIEYPGEHDDILIQFDTAETRDLFATALPAATMNRKFTVRRKI